MNEQQILGKFAFESHLACAWGKVKSWTNRWQFDSMIHSFRLLRYIHSKEQMLMWPCGEVLASHRHVFCAREAPDLAMHVGSYVAGRHMAISLLLSDFPDTYSTTSSSGGS